MNKKNGLWGMIASGALFAAALTIIMVCANIGYMWDVFFMKLCVVTAFTSPIFFGLSLFVYMVCRKREEKSEKGAEADKDEKPKFFL